MFVLLPVHLELLLTSLNSFRRQPVLYQSPPPPRPRLGIPRLLVQPLLRPRRSGPSPSIAAASNPLKQTTTPSPPSPTFLRTSPTRSSSLRNGFRYSSQRSRTRKRTRSWGSLKILETRSWVRPFSLLDQERELNRVGARQVRSFDEQLQVRSAGGRRLLDEL